MSEQSWQTRAAVREDLDWIVVLDAVSGGESRRGFFAKRLEAMARRSEGFLSLVAEVDGKGAGFVFARLLDGEFGRPQRVAVLDAIAVDPERQGHGIGHGLISALDAALAEQAIDELHTQAEWDRPGLMDFFSAIGFGLAPRLVLERRVENVEF